MRADFPAGVALVVGGSGGVGATASRLLARSGTDVAITYFGNEAKARATLESVRAEGRNGSVHRLDLADFEAVQALVAELASTYGRVHGVVHAAGSRITQPYIADLDLDEWKHVLDADVNGFLHVAKAILPHFREVGGGSITFVSTAGLRRFSQADILSIGPKGAIEALLRGIAREEGKFGTRANSVGVGVMDAGMFPDLVARGELDEAWIAAAKRNIALRRFGSAEEIAEAVVFLASDRASYVTGQHLMLDGGYSV